MPQVDQTGPATDQAADEAAGGATGRAADEAAGRVVIVGSLNIDLVCHVARHPAAGETVLGGDLERVFGGKGANQAVAAAGAGAQVVMVGHVGADDAGSAYRNRLSRLDIDVEHLSVDPDRPTGHALIVVDDAGENTIVVAPGANSSVHWAEAASRALPGLTSSDVLLLQQEIPAEATVAAIRGARECGTRIVLNMAPFAPLPADLLALVDVVIVNRREAAQLVVSGLRARSTVTTLGAEGATWDELRVEGVAVPAHEVVDTTGAGDAFCGALCAALVAGKDRPDALDAAARAGAAAVRHDGAQPHGRM